MTRSGHQQATKQKAPDIRDSEFSPGMETKSALRGDRDRSVGRLL